jgi:hypothetical protein
MGAGAGVDTCMALMLRRQDSDDSAAKGHSGPCAVRRQDTACAASTPASDSGFLWFDREVDVVVNTGASRRFCCCCSRCRQLDAGASLSPER